MGNTPTKVGIRLESTAEAGTILKGRIYLSVQTVRERARGLNLILEGEENTQIVTYEKINDSRQKMVNRDSSVVHRMEVPLISFKNGVINRGQYEYPFEWPLPADLPSSMRCQIDRSSSFCEIKYKLTAYLDKGNGLPSSGSKDPTINTVVVLLGAASDLDNRGLAKVALQEYPVKASCFGNKGSITMGLDIDTAIAAPQGTIHIGITGKNDSTSPLQHFTARLVETVTCSAAGRSRDFTRNLCTSKVSPPDNTAWDPLAKFSISASRQRRPRCSDDNTNKKKNETEEAAIENNRCMTQLFLPVDTRDTYQGKIIGVRHALVVEAVTPYFVAPTSIESSILMKVQRRMPSPPPSNNNNNNNGIISSSATTAAKIPSPSAPPSIFDENKDEYDQQLQTVLETSLQAIETTAIATATGVATAPAVDPVIPVAVAQLLPDDWKAEESEVVHIPAAATATVHK